MESLTSLPFWIGLSNHNDAENYEWLDKSSSTYRNWSNGGAVVNKYTQYCVLANSSGWRSESCYTILSSVCEYKLGQNYGLYYGLTNWQQHRCAKFFLHD